MRYFDNGATEKELIASMFQKLIINSIDRGNPEVQMLANYYWEKYKEGNFSNVTTKLIFEGLFLELGEKSFIVKEKSTGKFYFFISKSELADFLKISLTNIPKILDAGHYKSNFLVYKNVGNIE